MNAAETHLEEMNDLAGRILAMENTLESRETGKPTIAVWNLGRELAELVAHYKPSNIYEQAIDCLHDRGLNVDGLAAKMSEHDFWEFYGGPMLDHIKFAEHLKED